MSGGVERSGPSPIDFDRSINDVRDAGENVVSLPRRARLDPVGEGGVSSHTEVLLRPLSPHEKMVRRFLQPPVNNPAVAVPANYRWLLRSVARRLREHPDAGSRVLSRAVGVLDEVQSQADYLDVQMKRLLEA